MFTKVPVEDLRRDVEGRVILLKHLQFLLVVCLKGFRLTKEVKDSLTFTLTHPFKLFKIS